MKSRILCVSVLVLWGGVVSAGLTHHEFAFSLKNTGDGVGDARLRFHIDKLAVPGEEYFLDNITLSCEVPQKGPEILVNGNFNAGQAPWKFFTNAPAPQPTLDIVGGQAVITFGRDGSNTQLFQKNLVLPRSGSECVLEFDACSTGGPTNPGWGHNLGIELIKHGSPHTLYGLDLSGNPPNPDISIYSCGAGPVCGDGTLDPGEECDESGNTVSCDADCTEVYCGDGFTNPAAGEECDPDTPKGMGLCSFDCTVRPFCGDGTVDSPNFLGQFEDCDNGGGSVDNPASSESITCDTDCTSVICGDNVVNGTAGVIWQGPDAELYFEYPCFTAANMFMTTLYIRYGPAPYRFNVGQQIPLRIISYVGTLAKRAAEADGHELQIMRF